MGAPAITKVLGAKFTFSIVNNSAATVVIALLAAYFNTLRVATVVDAVTHVATNTLKYNDPSEIVASGYACDAVLDDGVVMTDVTCTSGNSEMTIRQMKNFIKSYGHTIEDIIVSASNVDAFDVTMKAIQQTPFEGSKPMYVNINEYKSPNQFDQLKVEIPGIGLPAGFDSLVLLPVKAGRTVTITFRFTV